MNPIRILHVVHALNRGGMESRIMDLYRNLNHSKYQYDFYVESGQIGMYDDEIRHLEGKIYFSQGKHFYNIPDFKAFYEFLLQHPEYKIVYAYNQWAGFYLKQAKRARVPYRIANARTSIDLKSTKNVIKNVIKNLIKLNVNKYATHRFAVSRKAANWLFGKNVASLSDLDGVKIWPNAIDTQKFAFSEKIRNEVREELKLHNYYTVIHVGNIRFEKNHEFLLKIFAEIKKKVKNTKLVLIGNGDIEILKPQMKHLGIEHEVIYLGVRQDIPRLLQAGDAFIFPSIYEGFPGAVLEAESSGLKCLISDSITHEVMLTEYIKAMSLKKSAVEWVNALDKINNPSRSMAWIKIREAGYDIKDLVNNIEHFYSEIIKNNS